MTPPALSQRYLHGPAVDQVLAVEDEGEDEVYWPFGDHEGTVRDVAVYDAALDETTVEEHRDYDAFGRPTDDFASPVAQGHAGRWWDAAASAYNVRARWYDPSTGRFLTEDPSGLASDANLYRYCGNNPLVNVDPSEDLGAELE